MKIILPILSILLLACTASKTEIPEWILSEKKFVSILKEVHLAEGEFELRKTNDKEDVQNSLQNNYQAICRSHNIDKNKFQKTLEYYANHPAELEEIYAKVLEELTKERTSLNP